MNLLFTPFSGPFLSPFFRFLCLIIYIFLCMFVNLDIYSFFWSLSFSFLLLSTVCLIIYIFLFYVCKFGYSLPFLIPFFLLSFTFYVLLFTYFSYMFVNVCIYPGINDTLLYFLLYLLNLDIHSLFCSLVSPFFAFYVVLFTYFSVLLVCLFDASFSFLYNWHAFTHWKQDLHNIHKAAYCTE